MLKIKNNVDLKKLEEFGDGGNTSHYIEYFPEGNCYRFEMYYSQDNYVTCHIDIDTRKLTIDVECDSYIDGSLDLRLLYDLIKADLVEKVDDEIR
jgi:hypothetical protein